MICNEDILIRKATIKDVDFLVDTIVFAEKSGTANFGLANLFEISEEDMCMYIKKILEEEIDGCEFSISSFIVAEHKGKVVAALAGWIEGQNEDGLSSSMLKSNLFSYVFPKDLIFKVRSKSEAVKPIQIERSIGAYQFDYGFTNQCYRGKGIMNAIIENHIQIAKTQGVRKMQVHIFENNLASINNYLRKGFDVKERYESHHPLTSIIFPYNVELLLEKEII